MTKMLIRLLIFSGFFAVHWIAQFLSWSYAERSATGRLCWRVLAAPLIQLSGSMSNQHFWIITVINSAVWAAVLTFLVFKMTSPRSRQNAGRS
jgi:hypothetical protein